jgi:hypothetical protein
MLDEVRRCLASSFFWRCSRQRLHLLLLAALSSSSSVCFFSLLLAAQLDGALADRLQALALVLVERLHHQLVDRVDEEEHLDARSLKASRCGEFSTCSRLSPVR